MPKEKSNSGKKIYGSGQVKKAVVRPAVGNHIKISVEKIKAAIIDLFNHRCLHSKSGRFAIKNFFLFSSKTVRAILMLGAQVFEWEAKLERM